MNPGYFILEGNLMISPSTASAAASAASDLPDDVGPHTQSALMMGPAFTRA